METHQERPQGTEECGCVEAGGPKAPRPPPPAHHTEMTSSSLWAWGSLPSSTQKKPDVPLAPAVRTSSSEWATALDGAGVRPAPEPLTRNPLLLPRGTLIPKEAHLLTAETCHSGIGARGAQQPPRPLRLVEHSEPCVCRADLHCRVTEWGRLGPWAGLLPYCPRAPQGLFYCQAALLLDLRATQSTPPAPERCLEGHTSGRASSLPTGTPKLVAGA